MVYDKPNMKQFLINTNRNAESITPKDDAFHGSQKHISAEWWYFDALFSNDYSIHLGLKTFSKKSIGILSPQIEIYKKGKFLVEETSKNFFSDIKISNDIPLVSINKNPIMKFDEENYKKTKQWNYDLNFQLKKCGLDLHYTGTSHGWKFETPAESWTVALPKAKVTGTIMIEGSEIPVQGIGYHDHNWNYSMITVMNYGQGWYWGKISSESFNIVWAKIVKSNQYEILAVVNKDDNEFFNINPESIQLETTNYKRVGRLKTPTKFILKIDEIINDTPVKVDLEMSSYGIHFNSVIVAPYWRFHIESKGTIQVGSKKEKVNPPQIMEYLRFS